MVQPAVADNSCQFLVEPPAHNIGLIRSVQVFPPAYYRPDILYLVVLPVAPI